MGGVLTGMFALGGILVGQIATARPDAAQEARKARKKRADKFEEPVAAVYEFDNWIGNHRLRAFSFRTDLPETVSPFARVQIDFIGLFSAVLGQLIIELQSAISTRSRTSKLPRTTVFAIIGLSLAIVNPQSVLAWGDDGHNAIALVVRTLYNKPTRRQADRAPGWPQQEAGTAGAPRRAQ